MRRAQLRRSAEAPFVGVPSGTGQLLGLGLGQNQRLPPPTAIVVSHCRDGWLSSCDISFQCVSWPLLF